MEDNGDEYTVNPIVLDATTAESFTLPPLTEEKIQSGMFYYWQIELSSILKSWSLQKYFIC